MFFGIRKYFLPIALFFGIFLVYLHNLSRSVFGGDVGDFVSSAMVMGVPHPSGYPLITLLGFILTRFHILTPAFMVGLISVFSASVATILFYFFSLEVTKSKLISILSVLVLAFNYLFWFYAEIAELFALNNLFVILLLFLSYLYYKTNKIKYLYILALFTGLSMTNNYIISFIFPSMVLLIFSNYKEFLKKPKIILNCFLLALLGFAVYLYIPIASFSNPPVNWGNVKDLGSFLDVILRKHYGTFGVGLTPDLVLMEKLVIQKNYFLYLIYQLTIPVIFICILGIISVFRKSKLLFVSFVLAFLLSGPFFIAIIGLPLLNSFFVGVYERFYSMSSVILLFFFPFGLQLFVQALNSFFGKRTYEKLFIAVFLIIPLLLFKYNFNKTDLHNVWIGDNLAYDIVRTLPLNSTLLLTGDNAIFNTWYIHFGLKVRPDINFITMVGNDSVGKLNKNYLKRFPKESNNPDLIVKVLLDLSKRSPVFSNLQIHPSKGKKTTWVPYGLVYELVSDPKKMPSKEKFLETQTKLWDSFINKNINLTNNLAVNIPTISEIVSAYSNSLLATGSYIYTHFNDSKLALLYFQKAVKFDNNNSNAYFILANFQMNNLNCKQAMDNLNKAININPLNNYAYYSLYIDHKYCFKNNNSAKEVAEHYKRIFKGDFFKDFKTNYKDITI